MMNQRRPKRTLMSRSIQSVILFLLLASQQTQAFVSTSRIKRWNPPSMASVDLVEAVDGLFRSEPYTAAFLTCSVKASAADYVAQRKSSFDAARNAAFFIYGGLYQGMFQELLFGELFPSWFGDDHSLQSIFIQVMTDMTLIGPFLCMPLAYMIKNAIQNQMSLEDVKNGISKYLNDLFSKNLLLNYWLIWLPTQSLTFGVVPIHYRVPFIAFVSFFWVVLLSRTSSSKPKRVSS